MILDTVSCSQTASRNKVNSKCYNPINFSVLPEEMIYEVFSYFPLSSLTICCLVNKKWNLIVKNHDFWEKAIYEQFFFGKKKWIELFENRKATKEERIEDFDSLPKDIFELFSSRCPAFPEKRVRETHLFVRIPKTINRKPMTINYFGELIKERLPETEKGYSFISPEIIKEIGEESVEKDSWMMMTRYILPESRRLSYEEQREMVSSLVPDGHYQLPKILEVTVCIFAEYIRSNDGVFVFGCNPWIYTRCEEIVNGRSVSVGGYVPYGLIINSHLYDYEWIGSVALRKL